MLTPTMHLIMSQQDVTDILRLLPQLFNIYHNKNDLVWFSILFQFVAIMACHCCTGDTRIFQNITSPRYHHQAPHIDQLTLFQSWNKSSAICFLIDFVYSPDILSINAMYILFGLFRGIFRGWGSMSPWAWPKSWVNVASVMICRRRSLITRRTILPSISSPLRN